jgi:hypothetical protein
MRSRYVRLVILLHLFVILISLLFKIGRLREVSMEHLGEEIAIVILLAITFLASSKEQWSRTFFNKAPVLIVYWLLVVIFTARFVEPPEKYWVFGFMGVIITSYYVPRWYHRRKFRENKYPQLAFKSSNLPAA